MTFQKGITPWNKGIKRPEIRGKNHYNWKGGRIKISRYIGIYKSDHPYCDKDGYVFEHRLIMEDCLKGYLNRDEHVHHINNNYTDNRVTNLKIVTSFEHTKLHHKGKKLTNEHKKKISLLNTGKKHTEEYKKKLALLFKGKHFSIKSEFRKGNIPWNKGIKGKTKNEKGRKIT